MRTVKVKSVKAVKANLTEPERGEIRKGSARGNLKRGETGQCPAPDCLFPFLWFRLAPLETMGRKE